MMTKNNLDIVSGGVKRLKASSEIVHKCQEGLYIYSKESEKAQYRLLMKKLFMLMKFLKDKKSGSI